jgi:hypothetical protein
MTRHRDGRYAARARVAMGKGGSNTMLTIRHWLAHRLGWNEGDIETHWAGGRLLVWFRCAGCGKVSGIHKAPDWITNV